ncbi:MAG: exodeoxyribonuclease V subunit beta [Syntrophobacteria bacterium]
METAEHFDLLKSPLEGTNLIEASAGTGKTYTITGLFLRLLLEKDLAVEQILVVTFTEAATGELQARIRGRLRDAIEALSRGGSEDEFLDELVRRQTDRANALRRLREALQAFDLAAVFTIHGFCRRMLYEKAFESSSLFDTELVTDQEHLKREIVEDFWRRSLYKASPLFVSYAVSEKFSPADLLSLLGTKFTQPHVHVIPQLDRPDSSSEEKYYEACFNEVRKCWQQARAEVKDILINHQGLNRNTYRKGDVPLWIHSMDEFLASGGNSPTFFKGFDKFTSSAIQRATKKDCAPPAHPFFECCEDLQKAQEELVRVFEQRLLGLKAELFDYVRNELARRKKERNLQSFDDLLTNLQSALEAEGGDELARAVRSKFRAALIDEFQDTDPVQYAIFRKIFTGEEAILFLIGDPKQAIYGFRGADVFTYMEAARQVERRYTLGENWRSQSDLTRAINTIFAGGDHTFIYDDIPFQRAEPANRQDLETLHINRKPQQPLQLWFLDANKGSPGKATTKQQARELIPGAVAAEISRLLSPGSKTFLGKRPLRASDIAVLVRRNAEARLMQQALSCLNIPSVLYSAGNLFDSHEAREMERVLAGIAEAHNERLVKAALATDMMGIKGEELDRFLADEAGWEEWLVRFREYHELWNERGFIVMFRRVLSGSMILPRLMVFPDGERRTTNLLHLAEVLHQAEVERRLGPPGLVKWLAEQRDSSTARLEEHQLRLESDEKAVKLVTVHKSKGLEYPVVFCPFTWDGSRLRSAKEPFIFHDEEKDMRLTLDLGSPEMDRNRVFAEKELLAENLRLLYVALTRAKNRCYLVWGKFNEGETSAPAYLFHRPLSEKQQSPVDGIAKRFTALGDEDVFRELAGVQERAKGTIGLCRMPTEAGYEYSPSPGEMVRLVPRKFSGKIDRQWRISSFSALVSGKPHMAEESDRDEVILPDSFEAVEEATAGEEPSGIFSFPRGRKAGTFLHAVLENLDFSQKNTVSTRKLVSDKLREYGLELAWRETVCDTIDKVLSTPLEPGRSGFTLSRVENRCRLNELEFYFPLKPITPKRLKSIFAQGTAGGFREDFPEHIERLDFSPVQGFMKGFIDCVFEFEGRFHLVDWKSNFLGCRVDDYGQDELAAVMEKEFYVLQYHIYTVALDQYLRARLPGYDYGSHFGGVYYIFLRGVDPARGPDYGIYRDRPPEDLIQALCANLLDQSG